MRDQSALNGLCFWENYARPESLFYESIQPEIIEQNLELVGQRVGEQGDLALFNCCDQTLDGCIVQSLVMFR
jgi:hypothetical protein